MQDETFPSRLMLALQPSWAVNPACLLANRMCCRSLLSMTPVNRRASIDPMVIGLQLRISVTSFPGFGIRVVLFSRYIRGKWRVRRATVIILTSTMTAPGFLRWALGHSVQAYGRAGLDPGQASDYLIVSDGSEEPADSDG